MHLTREVIGRREKQIFIDKPARKIRKLFLGKEMHEINIQVRDTRASWLGPNPRGANPLNKLNYGSII